MHNKRQPPTKRYQTEIAVAFENETEDIQTRRTNEYFSSTNNMTECPDVRKHTDHYKIRPNNLFRGYSEGDASLVLNASILLDKSQNKKVADDISVGEDGVHSSDNEKEVFNGR